MENVIESIKNDVRFNGFKGLAVTSKEGHELPLEFAIDQAIANETGRFILDINTSLKLGVEDKQIMAELKFNSPGPEKLFYNGFNLIIPAEGDQLERKRSFDYKWYPTEGITRALPEGSSISDINRPIQNQNFTLKEALNLMTGGSVCKERPGRFGVIKEVWYVMDKGLLVPFDPESGYRVDVKAQVKRLPIVGSDTAKLLSSLKKGNLQLVKMLVKGEEKRMLLQFDAPASRLRVYHVIAQQEEHKDLNAVNLSDTSQQKKEWNGLELSAQELKVLVEAAIELNHPKEAAAPELNNELTEPEDMTARLGEPHKTPENDWQQRMDNDPTSIEEQNGFYQPDQAKHNLLDDLAQIGSGINAFTTVPIQQPNAAVADDAPQVGIGKVQGTEKVADTQSKSKTEMAEKTTNKNTQNRRKGIGR